ncbi:putative HTH-type transcriptional repressor ExuR [compost metagenome]
MARKKKVSMQDIADELQVSKNAVSLALQNKKGVSDELRLQIINAAKHMGYGQFAEKDSPIANILVIVPERIMSYQDNDHFQFFHDMIWGLEKSIRKKGLNAVISPIDREMEEGLILPGVFKDIPYHGVIMFGIIDKDYARLIWEMDTPLVILDSYYRDLSCPVVTSSNIEGACEAVSLLIAKGHHDIGFIGPTNLTTSHEERWFGYLLAMQNHWIEVDNRYCLKFSRGFSDTGREISQFLDGLEKMPTAFFCGNDRIAYILSELLKERGLSVPDDVSIAGFDDLHYVDEAGLKMTTMRVEKEKMCDAAADLILQQTDRCRAAVRVFIPPTLVVRESVKRIG